MQLKTQYLLSQPFSIFLRQRNPQDNFEALENLCYNYIIGGQRSECHLYKQLKDYWEHAAGSANWLRTWNYAGTIKCKVNQPQLKVFLVTSAVTLVFHRTPG